MHEHVPSACMRHNCSRTCPSQHENGQDVEHAGSCEHDGVRAGMHAGGRRRDRLLRYHVLLQFCLTQPQARELIGDALARPDITQDMPMRRPPGQLDSFRW